MMRDLYADNYEERREVLLRAKGRYETSVGGQHCKNRLGAFTMSHAYQPYVEQFSIASASVSLHAAESMTIRKINRTTKIPVSFRAFWVMDGLCHPIGHDILILRAFFLPDPRGSPGLMVICCETAANHV